MNIGSTEFLTVIVLGSLFCMLMKIIKKNRDRRDVYIKTNEDKKKTPLFIHITIIIVIISLFVTNSGCVEQKEKTKIEIIQPTEKKIDWKVDVGGTADNIPGGSELWVLVYSDDRKQYYPITKAEIKNGEWTVDQIPIGPEDDEGKEFDVIAVLADKNAQDRFDDHLNETEEDIYSKGIYRIPDGVEEYDRITLKRDSDWI